MGLWGSGLWDCEKRTKTEVPEAPLFWCASLFSKSKREALQCRSTSNCETHFWSSYSPALEQGCLGENGGREKFELLKVPKRGSCMDKFYLHCFSRSISYLWSNRAYWRAPSKVRTDTTILVQRTRYRAKLAGLWGLARYTVPICPSL